jgi:hypothetical protein
MYGVDGAAGGRTTAAFVATPTWVQNITVNKKLIITAMIAIPTWLPMKNDPPILSAVRIHYPAMDERFKRLPRKIL